MSRIKTETDEDLLLRTEASAYLESLGFRLSVRSLEMMAMHNNAKKGPPFMRFGWRTIRYRRSDLKRWAAANIERVA